MAWGGIPHQVLLEDHLRDAFANVLLFVRRDANVGREQQAFFDRNDDVADDTPAVPKHDARALVAAEARLIGHTPGQIDLHHARGHRATVPTSLCHTKGGAIMPAREGGPLIVKGYAPKW